jgi:hypothetical protein
MKRLLAMFVLTPREQRLVIFVVLALVVGVSIKHQRDKRVNDGSRRSSPGSSLSRVVSPTPANDRVESIDDVNRINVRVIPPSL